MLLVYLIVFIFLIFFSAFFSSAETSVLSLNRIKLNLKAKKKNKKAILLTQILEKPEEFFSTILIGNNFVNIASASISTVVFSHLLIENEQLTLLISTVVTTLIILLFAEIIPKSYAFRYNERISYAYAYPLRFFSFLFYPLVKITTFISNIFFKKDMTSAKHTGLTIEEVKHFLSSQSELFRYSPESLRMVKEIIDISEKGIKSIMTPRPEIIALEENFNYNELKNIILGKKLNKVPIYRNKLDHIIGVIYSGDMISAMMKMKGDINFEGFEFKKIMRPPLFISEYSSLNYAFKQFKIHQLNIAIITDEYGTTIGILTLNDIFKEILGEINIQQPLVRQVGKNAFLLKGNIPVEQLNEHLHLHLPDKTDYTTLSGLFIYHFGKFPKEKNRIKIDNILLEVKKMGRHKIDEIRVIIEKD